MDEIKLLEYLDGNLDQKEALEIEAWVKESPENRALLEQVYYVDFIGKCVSADDHINVDSAFSKLQSQLNDREKDKNVKLKSRWRQLVIPIAAFLTGAILTASITLFLLDGNSKYVVATPTGQRAQFVLPDGSRVWLNSASELTYNTSLLSKTRKVDLDGEAYFEVEPNKNKPFIVSNKDVQVRVLGTKFNVRARASESRVVTTLLSGSVEVDIASGNGDEVILSPGEILDINTKNNSYILTESASASDVLLWMDGRLTFRQASFREIADCFEKHFNARFHFMDERLKAERFTCEFNTDDNITDILSVLEMTNRFEYKIKGRDIYLSAK